MNNVTIVLSSSVSSFFIHYLRNATKPCSTWTEDTDRHGMSLLIAKNSTLISVPRSPSPAARSPLMVMEENDKARRMDGVVASDEEGKGWEISFDEDDLESVASCSYTRDGGEGLQESEDNQKYVLRFISFHLAC
jgi:hypothetical protein